VPPMFSGFQRHPSGRLPYCHIPAKKETFLGHKNFFGKFKEIRAKFPRTPKYLPAPTPIQLTTVITANRRTASAMHSCKWFLLSVHPSF